MVRWFSQKKRRNFLHGKGTKPFTIGGNSTCNLSLPKIWSLYYAFLFKENEKRGIDGLLNFPSLFIAQSARLISDGPLKRYENKNNRFITIQIRSIHFLIELPIERRRCQACFLTFTVSYTGLPSNRHRDAIVSTFGLLRYLSEKTTQEVTRLLQLSYMTVER